MIINYKDLTNEVKQHNNFKHLFDKVNKSYKRVIFFDNGSHAQNFAIKKAQAGYMCSITPLMKENAQGKLVYNWKVCAVTITK